MIEQALALQKEVYLCFIDYTDAFDKVHDDIITQLTELKIDGKDPTVIKKQKKSEEIAAHSYTGRLGNILI